MRVVVCGTNFGRLYARAVRSLEPRLTLAGIVSRGSAHSRDLAAGLGVPHYDSVDALPDDVDAACVVVGSTISGGEGTDLARRLLARGVHVLQEHPVHHDEMTECLRLARRHRVQYRVNSHYPHVGPVREFIEAARRLAERQRPLFVEAISPVHVLYPLIDVLGRALGGVRPWRFADPAEPPDELRTLAGGRSHPLRGLYGVLAGVPVGLRVQNQLDPADRDNHALLWHRVAIGAEGGVLTLADTHGPVLWSPRFHAHRDSGHRLVLDGSAHLGLDSTTVLTEPVGTFRDILTTAWPAAIERALLEFAQAIDEAPDPLQAAQYDLTICRIWADIARRLGPPEIIRPDPPRVLSPAEIGPPAAPRTPRTPRAPRTPRTSGGYDFSGPYTPTAEFFDLAASGHVTGGTALAVVDALKGIDPGRGPIVEIGAGTGLITRALAKALPDAEIVAAEPAAGMRAVLTSRVFSDEDLRHRVTVTDQSAPDLDLPGVISAAVVCGVAGHLDASGRATLWRRLAERLAPGGVIVVELMSMDRPGSLPPTRLARESVGRQTYEWWFSGEPAGGDLMRLRTTWRVYRDGELVREVGDAYDWHAFGLDRVERESGLTLRTLPRVSSTPMAVLTNDGKASA
ncbi:thiazolinyl imide reductase [Thermocatellispora tengchongensis]|uniref:Thiazolinyl imide reductase n=1 Tax=Thermocatellispora tengchongensis TaxID=1073253 RepID=A0A840PE78_9ACTN|nr:Gfo/Idh/MocA family oxidoreductase [Thermocatellispora tengchongensis]MBB5135447.1 thiazolinyl imide reductase [Thermocatellispora tengchongensis]